MYTKLVKEVSSDERQVAKSAVLGCMYGAGAKTYKEYAQGYGITIHDAEAKRIVDTYRATPLSAKKVALNVRSSCLQFAPKRNQQCSRHTKVGHTKSQMILIELYNTHEHQHPPVQAERIWI
jgi:hypothetical protein